MKQFMGLDLWVYAPQGKAYSTYGGGTIITYNIHAVLGYRNLFKTIRSKTAARAQIAERVYDGRLDTAFIEANNLINKPNLFLAAVIGTHDKRTKTYKDFVELVDDYKTWLMEKIIKEEV